MTSCASTVAAYVSFLLLLILHPNQETWTWSLDLDH